MSRRAAFTQAELTRIFKAAKSAGPDTRVQFDDSRGFVVTYGNKAPAKEEAADAGGGLIQRRLEARRHG